MASHTPRVRVTLDTNVLPADELCSAAGESYDFAVVSVTAREVTGSSLEIRLTSFEQVSETGVFDESPWDEFLWATDDDPLEKVLDVISRGSFPKDTDRHDLSPGERRQLRDAMILSAHIRDRRDILVTNDARAFISHGRREALQAAFSVRIMTSQEFREYVVRRSGAAI